MDGKRKSLIRGIHDIVQLPIKLVHFAKAVARVPQKLRRIETSVAAMETSLATFQSSIELIGNTQQSLRTLLWEIEARRRGFSDTDLGQIQTNGMVAAASPGFDIAQTYSALRAQHPRELALWEQLAKNAEAEYRRMPTHSLSVEGNEISSLFRAFVRRYLHGRVLDVGCGGQDVPLYLMGYPTQLIAAIDPFGAPEDHSFLFVRALNEELPWPDSAFDTVINSTSLDHCIDLEKSLRETARVMSVRAILLVWVGFVPGASPYVIGREEPKAADRFHLYHFDRPWFEDLMTKHFRVVERAQIDVSSHFYAFAKLLASNE